MSMTTTFRIVRLSLAFTVAASVVVTAIPAGAQERRERKTILELLFGTPKRKEVVREPQVKKPRTANRKKKQTTTVATKPEPAAIEKLPDAKVVLVVGDFIAGSLGEGLIAAFEATPGIVVERRTNGSSGIVREDYYNWPTSLPTLITETKPALIVVSMGANDRQQMTVGGEKEKFRSEAWTKEYEARVGRLATLARNGGKPMMWIGMPAFQSSAMTADMTTLNNIYRAGVEKAGGEFVDIWDGFVDENGKFVISGSDINGQQVRLRGSDGINFTKAGKRKLAFYVEKEIRRVLGDAAADGPGLQGDLKDLVVTAPAEDTEITKTQPISLADPALDGGTALLGGAVIKGNGKSLREKLVEKGEIADAPLGRVDDFRVNKVATP
ncbi:SGNH/GDSL hydrolase family protein [Shinella sp. BE166]|uniref:SGNH/GDSL hydrolase family protein n=1 Tax=unclassified Shinella TaxID=2643062 RepID=UPI003EBB27D9